MDHKICILDWFKTGSFRLVSRLLSRLPQSSIAGRPTVCTFRTKLFAVFLMAAGTIGPCLAGGWYVGNTAGGDWITYENVWLSSGTYRFTARAGSAVGGSQMRVEVDNVAVISGVAVPNTGRVDKFANVHLGSKAIAAGYHDIKVYFETANVSLDWFMLRKDSDTSTSVKPSDITRLRPPTSGMLLAPVTAYAHQTEGPPNPKALTGQPLNDVNGGLYTDVQMQAWYSVPMFGILTGGRTVTGMSWSSNWWPHARRFHFFTAAEPLIS